MRLFQLSIISLLALILFGCGNPKDDENTLIVGTSADNPPYEYMKSNQIVGLDIEVIEEIAKHLGKKVKIENLDFNGLLAALSSDRVDLVIAGLSVTPERQAMVDFSDPYTSGSIAVLYRANDNFKDVTNLGNKVVGAQLGTIWSQFAQSVSIKHNAKVITLATNIALVEELKSKAVDAVILEQQQAINFMENNSELASFVIKSLTSDFAIALPKHSPLKVNIDGAIKALKEDGTIDKIMVKWLKGEF
ncbi:Putative amino acid ABC transporter substrate-binding protein [Candidatus Trichorickettsia mobilis]|uniref:Amino acid ABC transporter substrate-binding protein n=1 Tax=Candidatus Trichorickettsia mobilis TaxID=1346319 RepID=A0ABZ0UTJ9_9RICK|nr:ABC transporter substrate-binding protein [Candidatus Trichorickettsia mobilis]WPY01370.1 Putative amino acid ABC transporter substrate-binding protein [Candidatus Trichorickettsia mobilis]